MNSLQRQTWWDRHWKWFLPLFCVMSAALFAGFFIGIFALVFGMMKNSGAYQLAVARASHEPAVISALGQPITTGYFITGNISTGGNQGQARLVIPLRGPKGSASIRLRARECDGVWTYSLLTVDIDGTRQHLDLLQPPSSAAAK